MGGEGVSDFFFSKESKCDKKHVFWGVFFEGLKVEGEGGLASVSE